MATPSSPTVSGKEDEMPNHQTSAVETGTNTIPTPANNVGGGSGLGDKGFLKGNDGGHVSVRFAGHGAKKKKKRRPYDTPSKLTLWDESFGVD